MTRRVRCLFTTALAVFALQSAQLCAETVPKPQVPQEIEVPAGHTAYLKGQAVGTQNYICLPAGDSYAWTFVGPQATLYYSFTFLRDEIRQQITTHFLSSNPDEAGVARPAWQSSLDSSIIWGKAVGTSTDPSYVAPGAIPWLLVQIVGAERGPSGGSSLNQTTYIQRVNTAGGVKPADGCSQQEHVGKLALVPYTTDYYFFRPSRER